MRIYHNELMYKKYFFYFIIDIFPADIVKQLLKETWTHWAM